MSYLAQWIDPALETDPDETPERITQQETERLIKLHGIARAAAAIPRRIGTDAEPGDLSVDKKRSRRIAHVAIQLATSWASKPAEELQPAEDPVREAAIVNWQTWWNEHHTWLLNRQRYVATWSHRQSGNETWCKSAMVKLNNELLWLEYAMRD